MMKGSDLSTVYLILIFFCHVSNGKVKVNEKCRKLLKIENFLLKYKSHMNISVYYHRIKHELKNINRMWGRKLLRNN